MSIQLATISVIIPAYNRENTILTCLVSVINQTLQPIEIIVIDDCSADYTVKKVQDFRHPIVTVLQLDKNYGAQKARNEGIKAVKGEWIAFLDSDDEWMPTYLEEQYCLAESKNVSIVYSGAYFDDGISRKIFPVPDYSENTYKNLLSKPGPMFQGLFVRKKCLEEISFLDEKVVAFQEWDTAIRLAKHYRFAFNSSPLFVYNLHSGPTISKNLKNDVLGYSYVVQKHLSEIKELAGSKVVLDHLTLIQHKFYDLKDWPKWRRTSFSILDYSNSNIFDVVFRKMVIILAPEYYQRFQHYISPMFIIKRMYFMLFQKIKTVKS